jgi:flagellar hook-basal body complex protein FliE
VNPISTLSGLNMSSAYIDPTQQVQPTGGAGSTAQTGSPVSTASAFTQALSGAISSISGLQQNADQAIAGVATNNGTGIDQAMIAMEQASLGMKMATTVRDKAVEAYQSLINMQM